MDAPAYLNIAPVGYETLKDGQRQTDELSRFEKRLVHQLVRAEFPELVTVSKKGFIQIVRFNKEREDRIAADRRRELEERIGRQKGFRWIIEVRFDSFRHRPVAERLVERRMHALHDALQHSPREIASLTILHDRLCMVVISAISTSANVPRTASLASQSLPTWTITRPNSIEHKYVFPNEHHLLRHWFVRVKHS